MSRSYAPTDLLDYADSLVSSIRDEERGKVVSHLRDRLSLAKQAREAATQAPTNGMTFYIAGYVDALATAIEAVER